MRMLGEFMIRVLNRADAIAYCTRECSLCDIYGVRTTVLKMVVGLLKKDWAVFEKLTGYLAQPYMEFAFRYKTEGPFMWGLDNIGAFAYWSKDDIVKVLYDNRRIIGDIARIGKQYSLKVQECEEEKLDILIESAANELIVCGCK